MRRPSADAPQAAAADLEDLANLGREKADVFLAFNHAGTGDQNQRLSAAQSQRLTASDGKDVTQSACVYCSDRAR